MTPVNWPENVKPIAVEDVERLGIDTADQLYWNGKPIEIRRPLVLTRLQKLAAILVTLFAVLGGIGGFCSGLADASDFLCARHLDWLSCPAPR